MISAEQKIALKRQAMMAVLDEDWRLATDVISILWKEAEARRLSDPATCGHDFKRHEGLPNAICEKCGCELVPKKHHAPLFDNDPDGGPPQKEARGPEEVRRVVKCSACNDTKQIKRHTYGIPGYIFEQCPACALPRDPPCPRRTAGHRWLISDFYEDRCDACKMTRPRPKDRVAKPMQFGDESDIK